MMKTFMISILILVSFFDMKAQQVNIGNVYLTCKGEKVFLNIGDLDREYVRTVYFYRLPENYGNVDLIADLIVSGKMKKKNEKNGKDSFPFTKIEANNINTIFSKEDIDYLLVVKTVNREGLTKIENRVLKLKK